MTRIALLSTSDDVLLAALSSDADYTLVNLERLSNASALTHILGHCDAAILHVAGRQRDWQKVFDTTCTLVPTVLAIEDSGTATKSPSSPLTMLPDLRSLVQELLAEGGACNLAQLHHAVSAAIR